LVFAQIYELEKLKLASVTQAAHCLSLNELKKDEMFDQILPDNLQEIMEGITNRFIAKIIRCSPKTFPRKATKD